MKNRHVIATALVFGLGITAALGALSAEKATFILKSGERISGVLAIRTNEGRGNIRKDTRAFELSIDNGKDAQYIPVSQVATIDFVGGTPEKNELEALVRGQHSLAMRDGTNRKGRFIDMMEAETVRWQRENSSETEDIPIVHVRRVYLDTESAWNTFNFGPPNASSNTSGGGATTAPPTPGGAGVAVRANTPWTDAGLVVKRGERIRFVARGEVMFGGTAGQNAGPGGNGAMKNSSYPVPDLPVGALLGKVANGQPFAIGDNATAIEMPGAGRLLLGVNDDVHSDNSGAFRVQVLRGDGTVTSRGGGR
jgi:hypothetical protein